MEESAPIAPLTPAEVYQQARGNAGTFPLVLLAYAREQGRPLEEAAAFVGYKFAPSWAEARGQGAAAAMRWVALNLASGGAEVRDLAGDAARAEATVAGWPAAEDLAAFGLSRDEGDAFYGVFGPIAESLGLRFAWRRDGEAVTLVLTDDGAP